MASAACFIAVSGSPKQTFIQALAPQAAAKFELRTSARSTNAAPSSRVPDHIAEGMAAVGERDRVIPSQLDRPSSQALGFGGLL